MTRHSRSWLALGLLTMLPALAACTTGAAEPSESPAAAESESPTVTAPAASPDSPCGTADITELDETFGVGFGNGRGGNATVTQNDVTWTAYSCTWEAEGIEVEVRIAQHGDFEEDVVCLEPLAIGRELETVADLGDQAWWQFSDSSSVEGELRVCTPDTVLEVLVEAEAGESAALRDQAVDLAEIALSRL